MKLNIQKPLKWLTFDHLSEQKLLIHGVFLKQGGVSKGEFASLNFSVSAGDLPNNVSTNRNRALQALGIHQYSQLYQQHGCEIQEAQPATPQYGDALQTNRPHLGLLILHADCQAAIIYDPIQHAVSNVHCGWRGNVHNIYKATIEAMRGRYGSAPENLLVGISPSLGPGASEFIHYKSELPKSFYPFQIKPTYFDLWEISRWQLEECGILPHHIEIAQMCTYSGEEDFFSFRRFRASGRHGTLAALKA